MFACLNAISRPTHGILSRVLGRLTGPKIHLQEASAHGCGYLLLTTWPKKGGQMDWYAIREAIPPGVRALLTPQAHPLPERFDLRGGPFPAFEADLFLRTACTLISASQIPIYRRSVGLLDRTGQAAWMLPTLLRHASSVVVSSQNHPVYRQAGERMLEEMGALVRLSAPPGDFSGCILLLSPRGEEAPPAHHCPLLRAGSFSVAGPGPTVFSDPLALGEEDVPPGIPPNHFAGALYELCGARAWEGGAKTLLIDGRRAAVSEAAGILRAGAGYGDFRFSR